MMIKVRSGGWRLTIPVPLCLSFTGPGYRLISGVLGLCGSRDEGADGDMPPGGPQRIRDFSEIFTERQWRSLGAAIRRCRRRMNGEPLIQILSDESEVIITL